MGNYTLWCLNRVAYWDRSELADKLAVNGFFSSKHNVQLGRRSSFDRDPNWEAANAQKASDGSSVPGGILMHEDRACDEYFVPIAIKCIGDPDRFQTRFGQRMSSQGQSLFKAVVDDFYNPAQQWRTYWQPFSIASALHDVGMFTSDTGAAPFAGLYEIVADDAARNQRKAVLLGYSQGGTVARFLGWIDEYLMQDTQRSIAGVVTVQSPNHGSPLANPKNVDNVAVGLLGILSGLGGYPIITPQNPVTRGAIESLVQGTLNSSIPVPWHFGIGAVCDILDAMIQETPQDQPDKSDFMRTARKWLTGLLPTKQPTAFADMNPAGIDDPKSVLGRLMAFPHLNILHGAVVGADTALDDLVVEGMPWWKSLIVRHIVGQEYFEAAQSAYAHIAMDEVGAKIPMGTNEGLLGSLFQNGFSKAGIVTGIGPFAHDFVIPSVSQAMYTIETTPPSASFLGNTVNPKGTHISGADETDGDSDKNAVFQMLNNLGKRLD
jgi:hypothetical protein